MLPVHIFFVVTERECVCVCQHVLSVSCIHTRIHAHRTHLLWAAATTCISTHASVCPRRLTRTAPPGRMAGSTSTSTRVTRPLGASLARRHTINLNDCTTPGGTNLQERKGARISMHGAIRGIPAVRLRAWARKILETTLPSGC